MIMHAPTAAAAALLLATLAYHAVHANTEPVSEKALTATSPTAKKPTATVPDLSQAELQRLLRKPLFGVAMKNKPSSKQAPITQQPAELPKTRLQLTLSGIVSKSDKSQGHAIIGDQQFRVGDTVAPGATLHSVYSDRVVLQHNNRLEVLKLPDTDTASNQRLSNTGRRLQQKNLANKARQSRSK